MVEGSLFKVQGSRFILVQPSIINL